MKNSIIGFPRVGKLRELKFASEKYFRHEITKEELLKVAKDLRNEHFSFIKKQGIDYVPSNDFSFYDGVLDTAFLINAVPEEYKKLNLDDLDTYFAVARGYQGEKGDVCALAMKKWFNTNYHYIVPEISDDTELKLASNKPFELYKEAKEAGIETKPVVVGPFTFLKLAKYRGSKTIKDFVSSAAEAYKQILKKFNDEGVSWVQIDEPILVTDLTKEDINIFKQLYENILNEKGNLKVLLQTYFGDVRDCYNEVVSLSFDGIGLDFLEGKKNFELLSKNKFPEDKILFAGVLNGKNIWKCNYKKTLDLLNEINKYAKNVVIQTSCSLLHVPYTLDNEQKLDKEVKKYFSFAVEKLQELNELKVLAEASDLENEKAFKDNQDIFTKERVGQDKEVQNAVKNLTEEDFNRDTKRSEREKIQKEEFKLPILPTTTIGSFPQTREVKSNRSAFRKGEIDKAQYDKVVYGFIEKCIKDQEDMGIDVLVHGEFERNDMVEFFGENLAGYVFTEKAWVQSYGTRCVKPPIIFGDIKRTKPMTVDYIKYAQSLTNKPVKGMLTGPVTILNWSFPREDISLKEMAYEIGIAIRDEVCDLEKAGIKIIQIDEAALREKLPIRKDEWYSEYLDWAIPAFRLCNSKIKPETQIHTHMCYSEFSDIIKAIDNMDADVISFEASRSKLTILDDLNKNNFETEVGPGVYDIHSPRVPSVEEIVSALEKMLKKIDKNKLWVNPDCGLKTRGIKETDASLRNLVKAAKIVREKL
ncbi:5-methyltetrahydropteroyltriglutamate--homocysteine S-methyltransferase [Clostridium sp. HCP1S3_B4]|uniref:5-methyltetrahydropteroyltriglutamate-- homocysteine S-methyltransferase n=1 Tax=unclassified Clostridium TaxID=2614128 RepID=UPI002A7BD560|nr:5-methyltetrahydropteroyltriglutamate--homocysteine S-methyltransferase [Clostridiales bacterium]MDY2728500.1 5-methyltetrahydropteroyltriglutamate--homocysteine S-methyltransferase [Clostridium sp.]